MKKCFFLPPHLLSPRHRLLRNKPLRPKSPFIRLFSRDNLSAVNRELVTVSTLASLETVQNQLRSHLGILKNLGLNETELKRVVDEIRQQNPTAADKAESVLKDVVKAQ